MPYAASHRAPPGATVTVEELGFVTVIAINRPRVRNAVDSETAESLAAAFAAFDRNPRLRVAILTGAGQTFCAGADTREMSSDRARRRWGDRATPPMGPTRMRLAKPVIAAIEGYALGGGLELAAWCDMRVGGAGAIFGLSNRGRGLPLLDGGTFRLPRLIGESLALDLLLTGRRVDASEALRIGLLNRLVRSGTALSAAVELAEAIGAFPLPALRADLASVRRQWALSSETALDCEFSDASGTFDQWLGRETVARGAR